VKKHLDLFSGIGGFALAARWAGIETIGFCEIDKYAQKVLKKNFPGVPIYDDVTKLKGSQFKDIYLLTGGFPCQDISIAGKGAGLDGERSGLWTELHRIISEVRPKYALVENVPALTFRGGTRVIGDLTEIGYDCEWQIVGADDVGAPHRRKRIWIVAYSNSNSDKTKNTGKDGLKGKEKECLGEGNSTSRDTAGTSGNVRGETTFRHETEQDVAHSSNKRIRTWQRGAIPESLQENDARGDNQRGNGDNDNREIRESSVIQKDAEDVAHSTKQRLQGTKWQKHEGGRERFTECSEDVAHSKSKRVEGCRTGGEQEPHTHGQEGLSLCEGERSRAANWLPEPSVGRVVNGLPHRVDRLKGLGNAIVPQVAYEIMRCLK